MHAAVTRSPDPPTFNREIAPIFNQHCTGCHQPGQVGPFPLLTYADAKKHARQIVDVTARRYMPPWLPEDGFGKFEGERRLSSEQLSTIARWVAAGAPEGKGQAPAPEIAIAGWQLGSPDLVVRAGAPFTVPASGRDEFWNFTFRPDLPATRYVRAIEIRPAAANETRAVHHANVLIDRAGSSARLEAYPGAGFGGMEIALDRNPLDPPSHFLFWKPGSVPYTEPPGFSWRLDPGNVLVLNTHLQSGGRPRIVQPEIALYFTNQPPTEFPLLMELENDDALRIPAGRRDFLVGDDFRLPMAVQVLAIYPHAHYLGHVLEAYATLPGGKRKWLIRIPHWDLNWQAVYRYRSPVTLPAGTVVSMRFHYDNSQANIRNPNRPPKLVLAGNNASDEMGHLWLQVLPAGRGDRRRELEQALLEHRLAQQPDNFSAHLNLGALLLSRLRTQEAITELEAAIALDPKRPEPHDMLGSALRSVGESGEALVQYRQALAADPQYMDARYNLATTLARAGKLEAAIDNFRPVVAAFPQSERLHDEFGLLLERAGDRQGALDQFKAALEIDPADSLAKGKISASQ